MANRSKRIGKATVGFGPRYCKRLDSMHWAMDPKDSGQQDRFELAGIQMSPLAFFSAVVAS